MLIKPQQIRTPRPAALVQTIALGGVVLELATTRTALDAAAKKLMRAKAELKRLQAEVSA
jgi:hypothetical protein